jgi:hypothetical protein
MIFEFVRPILFPDSSRGGVRPRSGDTGRRESAGGEVEFAIRLAYRPWLGATVRDKRERAGGGVSHIRLPPRSSERLSARKNDTRLGES